MKFDDLRLIVNMVKKRNKAIEICIPDNESEIRKEIK